MLSCSNFGTFKLQNIITVDNIADCCGPKTTSCVLCDYSSGNYYYERKKEQQEENESEFRRLIIRCYDDVQCNHDNARTTLVIFLVSYLFQENTYTHMCVWKQKKEEEHCQEQGWS